MSTACVCQSSAVYNMSKFLHNDTNDDNKNDAKAIAVPRVFSKNSQAKNAYQKS